VARKPREEWSEAYRRRVESAERRGITSKAQQRGHTSHAAEVREKRDRRARNRAIQHVMEQLRAGPTKHRPNRDTVAEGMRAVQQTDPEALDVVIEFSRDDIMRLARLKYDELIMNYPEFENSDERNPFWYG
jgi:hypothetical protein